MKISASEKEYKAKFSVEWLEAVSVVVENANIRGIDLEKIKLVKSAEGKVM